ncbi:MAG: glutamate-5-semialdehyde dehydrogenase, partial [Pseudomonadota bacterium]
GNAVILRGGKESFHSSTAIHAALVDGLLAADLPAAAISLVPVKDRAAVGLMLTDMNQFIDVIIPRGGRSLIERVQADARLPVMGHLDGLCHIYVDREADLEMAISVVINSKLRRTGICGASETLLIDKAAPTGTTVALVEALQAAGCEVRGDEAVCAVNREVVPAKPDDWTTEYLDAIISVRMVDGVAGAAEHIEAFGSQHTDSIITDNEETAAWFLDAIDSAIVMHNASTQFADGGEFGMGAEIGIATGKLHARGPVGAEQLTSFKYIVRGRGSIRP